MEEQRSGKSEYTLRNLSKFLRLISKDANLDDPKQVLSFIANRQVCTGTKESLCYAYRKYCRFYKIEASIPYYEPDPKPVKIPSSEKLEMLIAYASKMLGTKLILSKEAGLRPIELHTLKVKDVDLEQKLIYPHTAKHGAARTLPMSARLQKRLQEHIIKNDLTPNQSLFNGSPKNYGKNFREMRNNLAKKLGDPTINTIRLYDFRHYFATNLYAKTQNILLVKQQMGHKRIETTLIYTQLLNLAETEWIVEGTTDKKRAEELLTANFTYQLTTPDGTMLFRKPK
jgi:integrase